MKDYNYYVYILTNFNNKVMYIGVTNNLERRLYEHKNGIFEGFTKKYNIKKLVYFEETNNGIWPCRHIWWILSIMERKYFHLILIRYKNNFSINNLKLFAFQNIF